MSSFHSPVSTALLILLTASSALGSHEQKTPKLSLGEAAARNADGRAILEGRNVVVSGVALVEPKTFLSDQYKLYIQDSSGGICLFSSPPQKDLPAVRVGDVVEAEGKIDTYAGMVEVKVNKVRVLARADVPEPAPVTLKELRSHRFYGRLVSLRAPVMGIRPIAKGFTVALGTPKEFIDLHITQKQLPGFKQDLFQPGSVIRIVGIASQYDHEAPFDSGWQIIPRTPADVKLMKSAPLFRKQDVGLAVGVVVALGLAVFFWILSLRRQVARQTRVYEESELKYRTLVESLTDGLAQSDEQGIIVFVNQRLCQITGYECKELVGKPVSTLTARVSDELFTRPDGSTFPVEIASVPMIDKGAVRGEVISFSDVSERVLLQRQLEQANRVKSLGHLAATVAHEFNNVLMGIQPFAELTRRHNPGNEMIRKATDSILQSVERGKRITLEILRYTRPVEPTLQPIAATAWLAGFADELRALIGSKIQLRIENRADKVHILADPAQLSQVFTNLVLNARDAMPNGGALTIVVQRPESGTHFSFGVVPDAHRYLHFAVRDEGVGIPPELVSRVFEPLFTTKKTGGTGLGLAVAHQVITRHGGLIFVESELQRGTTFHLLIPVTEVACAVDRSEPKATLPNVDRLLIIEDDVVVANGIQAMLEAEGLQVRTIGRGAEAVDTIHEFQPDALVLDIGLPDIDGVELYRQLSQRWPKLPVLFSTGHGDELKLQEYLGQDNIGFLLKPYGGESLLSQLEAIS